MITEIQMQRIKARPHLALTSAFGFAFSKIIPKLVTKTQTQRMGSVPILCINVNITIDTMLKLDANADANVNTEAECELTLSLNLKGCLHVLSSCQCSSKETDRLMDRMGSEPNMIVKRTVTIHTM